MRKTKALFIIFISIAVITLKLLSSSAHAQVTEQISVNQCGGESGNISQAFIQVPAGESSVYVRAERPEDAGLAHLYFQPIFSPDCIEIGSQQIKTDTWTIFGTMTGANTEAGVLALVVDTPPVSFNSADAPSVMFTDTTNLPCDLQNGCKLLFQQQMFELSPRLISSTFDTLRVGQLQDYRSDSIEKVLYSVDGRQVYTKSALEPFNMNYVPDGEHTIERTLLLSSGQALRSTEQVDRDFDVIVWLKSLYYRYVRSLQLLGVVVLALTLSITIWLVFVRMMRKRAWKRAHFPTAPKNGTSNPQQPIKYSSETMGVGEMLSSARKPLIVVAIACGLFFVTTSYILSIFTVDGVSMHPTLQDKSKQPLFRLPVTFGRINGNSYIPYRGSVVVVKKEEPAVFMDDINAKPSYVVKRVIGLPNERVVVNNSDITIYNNEHPEGFRPDEQFGWVTDLDPGAPLKIDITLKANQLFVVGDNRDESIDSRTYGPITASQIQGLVL